MPAGRPRNFDTGEALDAALEVFRRKGFEGASLADLTEATGVSRPSLYAAFGDKESLFRLALDRYAEGSRADLEAALAEPGPRDAAARLLEGAARRMTEPGRPRGCLLVAGALSCGDEGDAVKRELQLRRAASENELAARFRADGKRGLLPAGTDPTGLASFLASVLYGMSVMAAGGADRRRLLAVARTALRVFDAGRGKR